MRLLIDIGNSFAKWVFLSANGEFSEVGRAECRSGDDFFQYLVAAAPREGVDAIGVTSVAADGVTNPLCDKLAAEFSLPLLRANTVEPLECLCHCYADPGALGVDRWLAMLAVADRPVVCVADFGTAATIDMVVDGSHLGGVIAPGERLMSDGLLHKAAQIAAAGVAGEGWLANGTAESVALGARQAALALLLRYQELVLTKWPSACLVLTGGGAVPLLGACPSWEYRPNLVFEGLAKWMDLRG